MIFEYFIKNNGRYILWIDEIEKMMHGEKAQQVLGVLLMRINDLNSVGGSSLFVIATANNISAIARDNPEFLRNGRFDLLLFMLPPTEKNAVKIFNIYIVKAIKKLKNEIAPLLLRSAIDGIFEGENTRALLLQRQLLSLHEKKQFENIETFFKEQADSISSIIDKIRFPFSPESFIIHAMVAYRSNTSSDRFIYTPAEIQYIVDDVFFATYFTPGYLHELSENVSSENRENIECSVYGELASKYLPLQVTLSSSLNTMKGIASNFRQI